jgi:hypothetical protein
MMMEEDKVAINNKNIHKEMRGGKSRGERAVAKRHEDV